MNKVVVVLYIKSPKILIPKKSVFEANQIGLFNDIVINISSLEVNSLVNYKQVSPISNGCTYSHFLCCDSYIKGYKGVNYDDLIRSTTRISQRFDDPRFFSLLYIFLQNFIAVSDEMTHLVQSLSYLSYLFSDVVYLVFLTYTS